MKKGMFDNIDYVKLYKFVESSENFEFGLSREEEDAYTVEELASMNTIFHYQYDIPVQEMKDNKFEFLGYIGYLCGKYKYDKREKDFLALKDAISNLDKVIDISFDLEFVARTIEGTNNVITDEKTLSDVLFLSDNIGVLVVLTNIFKFPEMEEFLDLIKFLRNEFHMSMKMKDLYKLALNNPDCFPFIGVENPWEFKGKESKLIKIDPVVEYDVQLDLKELSKNKETLVDIFRKHVTHSVSEVMIELLGVVSVYETIGRKGNVTAHLNFTISSDFTDFVVKSTCDNNSYYRDVFHYMSFLDTAEVLKVLIEYDMFKKLPCFEELSNIIIDIAKAPMTPVKE